jgi:tetratricopeptide (TPR) repeat protein
LKDTDYKREAKPTVVLLLMAALILAIYSNTFHAAWHLDDKPNILEGVRLQIDNLHPITLWNTFFTEQESGKNELYRPLPCLSFALNWYVGQDETFGYHVVNVLIHLISSLFLYLATYNLLFTPGMKDRYRPVEARSIALLSTVLWVINPVQTQAITYIVQRMASMAAMFYIMGIYCFLRARTEQSDNRRMAILFYVGCLASYLGAFLSKENAIMLPLSLCLLEVIFYRDSRILIRDKRIVYALTAAIVLIVLLSVAFVATDGFGRFSGGYATRPFSMLERLLTQPRILILYLSQLFYPLPGRLSITHDIVVSTSLLSPWTTLPSLLACLLLIWLGLSMMAKRPLVSLAILFFFLNHVIESSVIPLELIFEHRNYLPSFFIFLPFAALLVHLINYYKERNSSMVVIIAVFVTLLTTGLGCFTYLRNRDWRTETTLWRDAMQKSPMNARPAWSLAIALAWDKNVTQVQLDTALVLFEKALSLNQVREGKTSLIWRNIGLIHLRMRAYEQAVTAFKQSLGIDPYFREVLFDMASAYILMGKLDMASAQLDKAVRAAKAGTAPDYYKMKGYILLWQGQPEKALNYLRKALAFAPENGDVLVNAGLALSLMGKHSDAERNFFKKALKISPAKIRCHYALIENSARAGEMEKAGGYAREILKNSASKRCLTVLKQCVTNIEQDRLIAS